MNSSPEYESIDAAVQFEEGSEAGRAANSATNDGARPSRLSKGGHHLSSARDKWRVWRLLLNYRRL